MQVGGEGVNISLKRRIERERWEGRGGGADKGLVFGALDDLAVLNNSSRVPGTLLAGGWGGGRGIQLNAEEKSRVRETPTLSTADSRTNTNLKRMRDLSTKKKSEAQKKNCTRWRKQTHTQTHRHMDMATHRPSRASGAELVKRTWSQIFFDC